MSKRSSDDIDNDHTDELPVLLETVVLEDEQSSFAPQRVETTSEHTALFQAVEQPTAGASTLQADLAARAAESTRLEAKLATITDRARDLEQRVAEKDQLIGELKHTVATLRESTEDTSAAERRLTTQLAIRDARIAEAATTVENLEREAATRGAELDRLRASAEVARRDTEAARRDAEAARRDAEAARRDAEAARREADAAKKALETKPEPAAATAGIQELLEDNAALRDYIAGRQAWWNELQTKQVALTERVAAMQEELATGKKALVAAEAFATRESERAVALRAELVEYARRVASLERELRGSRDTSAEPVTAAPTATDPAPSEPATPIDARAMETPPPVAEEVAVASDAVGAVAPAVEAIAQLEAEVSYKRQQVAAQLIEMRERDQQLQAAVADVERLRRELPTLRAELDESRATVGRLERAVIDKDRALEARDARIATLHEELKQRLGTIEKLNAIDFSLAKADSPSPTRSTSSEPGADNVAAPALLCLTGEAPKRFALTKKTITVGRGPQCDLQILTHFVSREHARITVTGGSVVIEDLGSRNGVYVNAVRIERHVLQQGDLLTIGETQFRFMESMAH